MTSRPRSGSSTSTTRHWPGPRRYQGRWGARPTIRCRAAFTSGASVSRTRRTASPLPRSFSPRRRRISSPSSSSRAGRCPMESRAPPTRTFRRSVSHNRDLSISAILTVDAGDGTTVGELELVDMNGDHLPDLIGYNQIAYNGYLSNASAKPGSGGNQMFNFVNLNLLFGFPRYVQQTTGSFGLSLGSIASVTTN